MAVYAEERFQPDLNDFVADRLLQDERLISLRFVGRQAHDRRFMGELAETVEEIVGQAPVAELLRSPGPSWSSSTAFPTGRGGRFRSLEKLRMCGGSC